MADDRRLVSWPAIRSRPLVLAATLLAIVTAAEAVGHRALHFPTGAVARYWSRPDWSGPAAATVDEDISTSRINRSEAQSTVPFSVRWTSTLAVPRAGLYRFASLSRGVSRISIDGRLVVDNPGNTDRLPAIGRLTLEAGAHDLVVDYAHVESRPVLQVMWGHEDDDLTPLPPAVLARERPTDRQLAIDRLLSSMRKALLTAWVALYLWMLIKWGVARPLAALTRDELTGAPRVHLIAVMMLAGLLCITGLWWGIPGYSWAPDELGPVDVLDGVATHFVDVESSRYPPFHYYVLTVATAPLIIANRLGYVASAPALVGTLMLVCFRIVSMVMALATVFVTYACAVRVVPRPAALLGALGLTLTSTFVFYGKLSNLDGPYLFWFALSLLAFVRIYDRGAKADYMLFAAAATIAVCTKDQAYGLYPLPAIAILWRTATGRTDGAAALVPRVVSVVTDGRLLSALGIGLGLFVVSHSVLWNARGFLAHVQAITGPASTGFRLFDASWHGQIALFMNTLWLLRLSQGWPLFVMAAAGAALAIVHGNNARLRTLWFALPSLSYYLCFIMVIGYEYDRFLLPNLLTLSVFAGLFAWWLIQASGGIRSLAGASVVGAFAYSVAYAGAVDLAMIQDSRYRIEEWLHMRADQNALIATVGGPYPTYLPRLNRYPTVAIERRFADLDGLNPTYLVVNADYADRFVPGTGDYEGYASLRSGATGYTPVVDTASWRRWGGLRLEDRFQGKAANLFTNVAKVDPHMMIYTRSSRTSQTAN